MLRKTPMKRGGFLRRTSMLSTASRSRKAQRVQYGRKAAEYLIAHPFDQIWIALRSLDEYLVIAVDGFVLVKGQLCRCPRSDQIHHRNKRNGERLTDERWWIATSRGSHEVVEQRKDWAREVGLLLPIQADPDGRWGDGNQALTTPELMAKGIAS
jgi:hypothetical protein